MSTVKRLKNTLSLFALTIAAACSSKNGPVKITSQPPITQPPVQSLAPESVKTTEEPAPVVAYSGETLTLFSHADGKTTARITLKGDAVKNKSAMTLFSALTGKGVIETRNGSVITRTDGSISVSFDEATGLYKVDFMIDPATGALIGKSSNLDLSGEFVNVISEDNFTLSKNPVTGVWKGKYTIEGQDAKAMFDAMTLDASRISRKTATILVGAPVDETHKLTDQEIAAGKLFNSDQEGRRASDASKIAKAEKSASESDVKVVTVTKRGEDLICKERQEIVKQDPEDKAFEDEMKSVIDIPVVESEKTYFCELRFAFQGEPGQP